MSMTKKEYLNETKEKFYREIKKYQSKLKPTKEIEGYGNLPIVGEKGYPNISTHSISNQEKQSSYAYASEFVKKDYENVIKSKAKNILGSTDTSYIKKVDDRITEELRDIYKAKKPTEFSSEFEKELKFDKILTNKVAGIMGSKNPLQKLEATENIQTSKAIEYFTGDDIKSKEALITLYEKGLPEQQIIAMLSLGSFGISHNRKLVPTRWAITAYDQTIEKYLHKKLLHYTSIESYEVYHYNDKGNEFVIILFPDTFTAEVIEQFSNVFEQDYVGVDNKLHKKEPETAGGFYATKIGLFEHLNSRKKQASMLSIRIIKDYELPLGVIFVRESVREAMKKRKFKSTSKNDLEEFLKIKFPNHYIYYKESQSLKEQQRTRKLNEFM